MTTKKLVCEKAWRQFAVQFSNKELSNVCFLISLTLFTYIVTRVITYKGLSILWSYCTQFCDLFFLDFVKSVIILTYKARKNNVQKSCSYLTKGISSMAFIRKITFYSSPKRHCALLIVQSGRMRQGKKKLWILRSKPGLYVKVCPFMIMESLDKEQVSHIHRYMGWCIAQC